MAKLDTDLQNEIKKNKALTTMYAELIARYEAEVQHANGLASTIEQLLKASTIADLPQGVLFYKKTDGTLASVTQVKWTWNDFRLDLQGDINPSGLDDKQTIILKHDVSYKLHMKFKAQVVASKGPTGIVNHYAKLYELDTAGKPIGELQLESFEVLQSDTLASHMMWWNPKLDLSLSAGVSQKTEFNWTGEIGLSLSAHGVTQDDITWRFFRLGIGVANKTDFNLSFAPVLYNVGKNLPLVSNSWVFPYLGYNFGSSTLHAGGGLGVVF
jgi:hypothetical protein